VVDADFIFSNLKQKLARKTKNNPHRKKQNRKSLWGGSNIEK
jgi:hypothetical protein